MISAFRGKGATMDMQISTTRQSRHHYETITRCAKPSRLLVFVFLVAFVMQTNAENNTSVIITGPATTNIVGTEIIGNTGTNNSLQIYNAGAVTNGMGVIGNNAGANFNYVIVQDPGSIW